MTILQRSTFVGTEHADVRPGAYTKTSVVEGIVKDQAYLYERITNLAVPNAASISATGHTHTGNGDGALIRIPYCQQPLGILLERRTSAPISGGIDYAGFSPCVWMPFYCPLNVSEVMCVLWVDAATEAQLLTFRGVVLTSGFVEVNSPINPENHSNYRWLQPPDDSVHGLVFVLPTNPGAVCTLKIEAWDGYYTAAVPPTQAGELLAATRRIYGMTFGPYIREPNRNLLQYSTPTSTQAILSVPSSFTSFDDELIANDTGVSGYHLVSIEKNDALLHEILTDKPAGAEASQTVNGHNHAGGTTLALAGNSVPRTLGAWVYGTVRPPPEDGTGSTYYEYADVIGNPPTVKFSNVWSGGSSAITITTGAGTSWVTVAKHLVRIPEAIAANVAAGTGKLVGVAMVYFDPSKATRLDVRMSLGSVSDTNYGATSSDFTTATGRDLLQCTGIQCQNPTTSGTVCTLKVEMKNTVSSNSASFLYGVALYYEP